MKKTTKIIKVGYWLLMVLLVTIAGLSALSVIGLPQNFRAFVVQSGSMSPAIKTGSLVFIQPSTNYVKGDVITVKVGEDADIKNPKATITHRVVDIIQKDKQTFYTTKGDANDTPDMTPRPANLVLGKVVLTIPFLGYPVGFIKTSTGFIIAIVIPATIIVYGELLNIRKELTAIISKRRLSQSSHDQKTV